MITAVLFAGLGFVAGARAAPGHLAAAPDPLLRGAEMSGDCEAALPPGHPPIGSLKLLPPGHPPVPGFRRLPAGHPPIPSTAPAERLLRQLQAVSI